ncbi:hypothetical protein Y1Q_0011137 [Alligator mississippiensis]|uniref:Uncharacterized protein n=1 Tax=Alligator mississippiensis TaxID=8496 RepID=A0A151NM42_ALLMI|nr:hypothetical protein Y1Q_0011137 [Alligator mississippiensis]
MGALGSTDGPKGPTYYLRKLPVLPGTDTAAKKVPPLGESSANKASTATAWIPDRVCRVASPRKKDQCTQNGSCTSWSSHWIRHCWVSQPPGAPAC